MARYDASMEAMADTYIFETTTMLEQLDEILMRAEKDNDMGEEDINEIFRIMHTIKGSSAMMGLDNMSVLGHSVEDMFFVLRENKELAKNISHLYELVFEASDLLKAELEMIQEDNTEPTDFSELRNKISDYIEVLKRGETDPVATSSSTKAVVKTDAQTQNAVIDKNKNPDITTIKVYFEDGCLMENLRALILYNSVKEECSYIDIIPSDIETNPETSKQIVDSGFIINFVSHTTVDDILKIVENALNVKSYEIIEQPNETVKPKAEQSQQQDAKASSNQAVKSQATQQANTKAIPKSNNTADKVTSVKQSLISVNLRKLDQLLDMVGEIVITEAMVTSSPDLKGLKLDSFSKASRQLRKLTDELQDIVMSIRMVPLSGVFNKMSRIVRDMNVKQGKNVDLVFEGEDTEVDKSIIDNLNDPMMHMVRNAMDHGIETPEEYAASGKTEKSRVTLSAYNASSEVVIIVSDNGKGMDPKKIMAKAKEQGILTKPEEEYTEKEIVNLIMAPGFSTNQTVTEFSGRGVGTDVVKRNIEKIGGTVTVYSKLGQGTNFVIKIPLSLAIVDAMEVSVGESIFAIPTNSIKESFKLKPNQLVHDTEKGEMIMIRGECFPLIRLSEFYEINSKYTNLEEGIIILVEADGKQTCLFADELIGEQQVVVKPFSALLNKFNVKHNGMAGCSILGDGSITIILDINNILSDY